MSNQLSTIWSADPHTIAKIEILKGYLKAWLRILGATRPQETILYVDGFAGPGYYQNHPEGSPIAALGVAQEAIFELGEKFKAAKIHGAFIESDPERFKALSETLLKFENRPSLGVTKHCCEFVDGIRRVRNELPDPFQGKSPLFVFADPFGGTGIPFTTFAECMESDTAELLINLDADGIARIFYAESNNKRDEHLTDLFGSDCWRTKLTATNDLKRLSVQILDLYKERLRTLPGVKFIWSFAMRGKRDNLNYHLVFATKHRLGLEKMKEAMQAIDKSGSYSFSDAHVEQHDLFRNDDPETYAKELLREFDGKTITIEEANIYALNETPFINANQMLAVLEKEESVKIESVIGEVRRAGSYPKEKIQSLRFGSIGPKVFQSKLF